MQLHSTKIRIRNKAFQNKINGIRKDRLLGVSIDWSKSFHKVMLFDFNGEIIRKPFEVNTLLSGYKKLISVIEKEQKNKNYKKVFIVIEPSGSWGHSLQVNLGKDFEDVWLVTPSATAANREQKLMKGLKTDDIDLCALADLLIRGECYKYVPDESPYLDLKLRTYWRHNKINIQTKLKHQIINRLAKCYPSVIKTPSRIRLSYSTIFRAKIFNYILKLNLVPSEILALKDEDMRAIFHKEIKNTQTRYINTIKKAFSEYLAPPDELVKKELEMLNKDIYLLNILKKEIDIVEKEMIELVKLTRGKYLLNQIKGLTDTAVACYIGVIGDVRKYSDAKKIFSKAGLAPVVKESGGRIRKGLGINRVGNKYLRTLLFKTARMIILVEPYFYSHYHHLHEDMKKPYKKAIISVAKKLNNTMFAMMRDKRPFDPPPYKHVYKNKPLAEI